MRTRLDENDIDIDRAWAERRREHERLRAGADYESLFGVTQPAMYLLVCEGTCNPQIGHVDAAVALYANAISEHNRRMPVLTARTIEALRRLRHTLHEATSTCDARCTKCGTERKFGAS